MELGIGLPMQLKMLQVRSKKIISSLVVWWKGDSTDGSLTDYVNTGDDRGIEEGKTFFGDSTYNASISGSPVEALIDSDTIIYASIFIPTFVSSKIIFEASKTGAEIFTITQDAADSVVLSTGYEEGSITEDIQNKYVEVIFSRSEAHYRVVAEYYDPNVTNVDVSDGSWTNVTLSSISSPATNSRIYLFPDNTSLSKIGTVAILDSSMLIEAMWSASCIVGTDVKDLIGSVDLAITGDINSFVVDDNYFHNYNNENGFTETPVYYPAMLNQNGVITGYDSNGGILEFRGSVPLNATITGSIQGDYIASNNTMIPPKCPKLFLADLPLRYLFGAYIEHKPASYSTDGRCSRAILAERVVEATGTDPNFYLGITISSTLALPVEFSGKLVRISFYAKAETDSEKIGKVLSKISNPSVIPTVDQTVSNPPLTDEYQKYEFKDIYWEVGACRLYFQGGANEQGQKMYFKDVQVRLEEDLGEYSNQRPNELVDIRAEYDVNDAHIIYSNAEEGMWRDLRVYKNALTNQYDQDQALTAVDGAYRAVNPDGRPIITADGYFIYIKR